MAARRVHRTRKGQPFDRYPLLFYGALVVYAAFIAFGAYKFFSAAYNTRLVTSARVMASVLPALDVAALSGKPEDQAKPEYRRLYTTMSSFLLSDPNIKYAYLFTLRDGKEISYLSVPEPPQGLDNPPGTVIGLTEPEEDRFFEKGGSIVFKPYHDPWGFWVSVAVPALRDLATGRVLVAFGYDVAVSNWLLFASITVFGVILILSVGGALVWLGMDRMRRLKLRAEHRAEAAGRKRELAEASERAERDFLALMSHEIRNPLSAVVGFSRLLSETRLDPEQRGHVEMLRSSSDHLMDLVNDILDFSKIEAGKMEIVAQPFSPSRLAEEIVSLFSLQALRKGLDLRLEVDPACPSFLSGDAIRVRQILVNLISNAVKFTEAGRVVLRYAYSDSSSPARLSFAVEDSGPGMDAETLARLFTAFKQGQEGRRKGGTGLGLAISKSLAELMGGSISAASVLGSGSVFTVELPLPPCEAPPEELAELGSLLAGLRILAADDDAANRALVTTLLERRGATVVAVADGEEALADLLAGVHTGSIDAAVLDRSMPRKDGPAVARALRAAEASASLPPLRLVALTGSISVEGVRECRDAGFDVVLPKPFDVDRLVEALLPNKAPKEAPSANVVEGEGSSRESPSPAVAVCGHGRSAKTAQDDGKLAVAPRGLIDEEALRARTEGDAELATILRDSFMDTLSESLSAAEKALGMGDLPAAAAAAHKVRGSALNACAKEVARLAGELEEAARAGDSSRSQAAFGDLATLRAARP